MALELRLFLAVSIQNTSMKCFCAQLGSIGEFTRPAGLQTRGVRNKAIHQRAKAFLMHMYFADIRQQLALPESLWSQHSILHAVSIYSSVQGRLRSVW